MEMLQEIVAIFSKFFIAAFIYAGLSCNSPNGPVVNNTQTIDTAQLDSLDFQQISYDTVLIKNNSTITLDPKYFEGIFVGSYDQGAFTAQDTLKPVFDGDHLIINYKMSFPDTQLAANIGVKFIFGNGTDHIVYKAVNLYQYPYPSTKLLLRWDDFLLRSFFIPDIQDFAFIPPKIFYHPYGSYGLYGYNMDTNETQLLYDYSAGDNLGANLQYIIIDYEHRKLYRYVLSKDSVDKKYDTQSDIYGIACSDSLIYVSCAYKLFTFSMDLNLISTVDISYNIFSMGYYNNYLYGSFIDIVYKIDPKNGEIVEQKKAPGRDVEGIFIYGDNFYYSDYTKEYIGYTPIKDIFPN